MTDDACWKEGVVRDRLNKGGMGNYCIALRACIV